MLSDSARLVGDIHAVTGIDCAAADWRSVAGGDINRAVCLRQADGTQWFLKLNSAHRADMFAAELAGLEELQAADVVRVPRPLGHGVSDDHAWLLLEWLPLGGARSGAERELGRVLAAMHTHTHEHFGWWRDNTIGTTPQRNAVADDWLAFYREQRLGAQLEFAAANGAAGAVIDAGHRLMEEFDTLFTGYTPAPSLLHGDLWGGNWGVLEDGSPVIFDPAVYFGDREADIAMTRLFGGFGSEFYSAYNEAWPLDSGYGVREDLYNLYHVLNHFNLFGGGYQHQAEAMTQKLLAEIR